MQLRICIQDPCFLKLTFRELLKVLTFFDQILNSAAEWRFNSYYLYIMSNIKRIWSKFESLFWEFKYYFPILNKEYDF